MPGRRSATRSIVVALAAAGCLDGCGHAPAATDGDGAGWIGVRGVPLQRQRAEADCGAAALAMVTAYWRVGGTAADVAAAHPPDADHGIRAGDLRDYARARGLGAFLIAGTLEDLVVELGRGHPVLVGVVRRGARTVYGHYELVVGVNRGAGAVRLLDPASGPHVQGLSAFSAAWSGAGHVTLILLPPATAAARAGGGAGTGRAVSGQAGQ